MRLHSLLALLMITFAFAGCFGGDDDEDEHCEPGHVDEHCPAGTETTTAAGTGTASPTTSATPNEPPVAALDIQDANGTSTQVTLLGGSLTFDGSASEDPDGEITEMAVIVTDSNSTRSAQLVQNGQFVPATFTFDRPGVVVVVANVLDDRGDRHSITREAYVNHPQTLNSFKFNGANPVLTADACGGDAGELVDTTYTKKYDFDVKAGATFVEASVAFSGDAGGEGRFAVCDPDGNPLSGEGSGDETITTEPGTEFEASLNYGVWVVSDQPRTDAQPSVIVHYEPQDSVTPDA